jgi:archaellum component FlaC
MKRNELKAKFEELGLEAKEELLNFIMDENGNDILIAKNSQSQTVAKLQEEVNNLKTQNEKLTTDASKYADYDELKEFKANTLAETEKNQKIDFLKAQGCKYPELFLEKVDWTKATFNTEKKTYEGIDETLKGFKGTYKDMFKQPERNNILIPDNPYSTSNEMSGVEKAFYANNPNLMPGK